VRLDACRRAQRDAAQAEDRRLLGGGERSRVPDPVAEVEPDVEARQDEVDRSPLMGPERDAVGRRAVDTIRIEIADRGSAVRERPRGGDRVPG
jgi:hypothetical protein